MHQPTICVDFDGVIHRYSQGWQGGEIYDPPTDGCAEALAELGKRGRVVICTARENTAAVVLWLRKWNLDRLVVEITNTKPIAAVYIDDRAVHHTDWKTTLRAVSERL